MNELPHHFIKKHVNFINNQNYTVCNETNSNNDKSNKNKVAACKELKAPPPLVPNYPITVCSLQLDIVDVITDRNKRKRKSHIWRNLIYPYNTAEIKRIKLTEYLSIQRLKRLSEERRRRRQEKIQDKNDNPTALKIFLSKIFGKRRQRNNPVNERSSQVDNGNIQQSEAEKQPTNQEIKTTDENISLVEKCEPCAKKKDVCPIELGCGGIKNFCDICYTPSKSTTTNIDQEESGKRRVSIRDDSQILKDSDKPSNEKLVMQQHDVVFELNHKVDSTTVQNCGTQVNTISLHASKSKKEKIRKNIGARLNKRVSIANNFINHNNPRTTSEIERTCRNSRYLRKYSSSMLSINNPEKILGNSNKNYEYELTNFNRNEVTDQQKIGNLDQQERYYGDILDCNKIQYISDSTSAENSSCSGYSQSEGNETLNEVERVNIGYENDDHHLIKLSMRDRSDMNVQDANIARKTKRGCSKTRAQIYYISKNSGLNVDKSVQIIVIPPNNLHVAHRTTSIDHSDMMLNLAFNNSKSTSCEKYHKYVHKSKSQSSLTASDSNFVLHCEDVVKKEIYLSDIDIASKDSEEYRKQRTMEVAVKVSRLLKEMEANGEKANVIFVNTKYYRKR